jgi:two-component system, sensor histidine kinase RegB
MASHDSPAEQAAVTLRLGAPDRRARVAKPVRVSVTPCTESLALVLSWRVAAVPLQMLAVWLSTQALELKFNAAGATMVILIQAAVTALTWVRLKRVERPVDEAEVAAHVVLEIVLMSALLFFSGGTSNPFAPLLLLPLVAAAALPPRWVWAMGLVTAAAYMALRGYAEPLAHALGPMEVLRLHANGDQVSYFICAMTLAYFIARMVGTARRYEQMLADVQERQIREDSVVAIGALAAGCAHELSTPLSTMGMLVTELHEQIERSSPAHGHLRLIEQQLAISKGIIRKLAGVAQRRIEERQQAVSVEQFLADIVARARTLHPAVPITYAKPVLGVAQPIFPDEVFRQAIHVLIDNAAQAARSEVSIRTWMIGADLGIVVCDDGAGFPDAVLAQLGRSRFSTKHAVAGSGIGLVLATVTAHRMGGTLKLTNQPDSGACAQLIVPLGSLTQ